MKDPTKFQMINIMDEEGKVQKIGHDRWLETIKDRIEIDEVPDKEKAQLMEKCSSNDRSQLLFLASIRSSTLSFIISLIYLCAPRLLVADVAEMILADCENQSDLLYEIVASDASGDLTWSIYSRLCAHGSCSSFSGCLEVSIRVTDSQKRMIKCSKFVEAMQLVLWLDAQQPHTIDAPSSTFANVLPELIQKCESLGILHVWHFLNSCFRRRATTAFSSLPKENRTLVLHAVATCGSQAHYYRLLFFLPLFGAEI